MKRIATTLAALLATAAADALQYKRMDDAMTAYGYTYEAIKVETDDGFILTTFHITGMSGGELFKPDKPPVLIQHGDSADGPSWVGGY